MYGLDTPPFPDDPSAYTIGAGEWVLKDYPSDYLPLEARLRLTADMVAAIQASIFTQTEVTKVSYDSPVDSFRLLLRDSGGRETEVVTRRVLLATGRFGPLGLRTLTRERDFRRLEVGFRIEQASADAFFKDMKQLDPKLRFREQDGSAEWRTFCACRDGEAALTETQGLWTVSGRSDCPPTGRSNVGFNTRILDEPLAERVADAMLSAMARESAYFVVPLTALVDDDPAATMMFDRVYGSELREVMVRGLSRLAAAFPGIRSDGTRLIGPTLEGVGWYPRVDGGLRLMDVPAWVAGDACGLFRGIVAAMISGHYASSFVLRELETLR